MTRVELPSINSCRRPAYRLSWLRRLLQGVALSVLVLAAPAQAESKQPWDQLPAEQQQLLAPLRERWGSLPPERHSRLMQGAPR